LIKTSTVFGDVKKVRNAIPDRGSEQLHLHQREMSRHSPISKSQYLLEKAQRLLLEKYPQYQKIGLGQLCIMIWPEKVLTWKMSSGGKAG
jgi:hypothetical protein